MKAVILAAGVGSRLRPLTNVKPKTMVQVNGKPMLGYLLDNLLENGIQQIVLCVGYKAETIINYCKHEYPTLNFTFVHNTDYAITNNMYSLYLARDHLNEDIILMNADLVFDSSIIKYLKEHKGSCVAVEEGTYNEESMKVTVSDNIITGISKKINKEDAYGCSIDVYKICKEDLSTLLSEMDDIIVNKNDRNQWTEVLLDNLFKSKKLIAKPSSVPKNSWFEIDNFDDLAQAELLFNEKIKELKNKKIFFIDRDGTLTLGDRIMAGSNSFLELLSFKNKIFYILTNNSSKTPRQHYEQFNRAGLKLKEHNVLVSLQPTLLYLKQEGFTNLFWVANERVSKYIREQGFVFDDSNPQAVLLTYDDEINYAKLKKIISFIRKGYPYYATHLDTLCPTNEGLIPDIGTFIQVIETATGSLPNKTFGKPNLDFIKPILDKHGLCEKDAVIIGDRLYTDIKLAENSEMTSVLVLTGETKREDYEFSDVDADIIVPDLKTLGNYL